MQVFNAFIKIARKRLGTIITYFSVFAVLCFIMTSQRDTQFNSNFQSTSLDICIIDRDGSTASVALTDYLSSIHNRIDLPDDEEVLQDNLYYRYVDYILTIPEGFEKKLKNGTDSELLTNVKIPGSGNGAFIDQQIDSYLQTIQMYLAGGYTLENAIASTDSFLAESPDVTSVSFTKENSNDSDAFYFFRYLPYVLVAILISGLSPLLVTMNEKDLRARTTCSSLSLSNHNLQVSLGATVYSLSIWLAFMLLGIIFYRTEMFTTNALYAMLNSFIFLLFTASVTLLISLFSPSQNVANMLSNVIGLSMSFLCGVFVPQSMLSENIVKASRFLPAYWYTRANDMLGGLSDTALSIEDYWQSILVQLLFTVAIFVAILVTSKLKQQRTKN
ncbi:MAG: ABC transporter permease [Roseburia sp.]